MRILIPLAASLLTLAACQQAEPRPGAEAEAARGEASTGAGGAITGRTDPNPTGAGATAGATTSDSTADMGSTSPTSPAASPEAVPPTTP
jgi:hypothetical protein